MTHAAWNKIEAALRHGRGAIAAGIAGPELSPWGLCTLVALARHRRRQAWVGDVVRDRLGGDLRALARLGAAGHPEHLAQLGDTPGLPGWTYYFHGRGCCLTNAESGVSIDVDFVEDGRTDVIDPFFFASYLESLRQPEPVEACLVALHPSLLTVAVSIAELVEQGLVSSGRTALTDEARAHEALLCELGDRFASEPQLTEPVLARRRAWLIARDRTDPHGGALRALAETSPADLATHLRAVLEATPLDGRTSTALALVAEQDDPAACPAVWELFRRLDPGGPVPQPHLWALCSAFLLRHAYRTDDVIATLADAGGTEVGEAALLALEYAPALGRPLLRKALRSRVPLCRGVAAATLALLEADWALDELHAPLSEIPSLAREPSGDRSETTDEGLTAECRAALRSLGDPRGACARWELAHAPAVAEDGAPLTIGQLVVLGTDEWVLDEIERLRERVRRIGRSLPGRTLS